MVSAHSQSCSAIIPSTSRTFSSPGKNTHAHWQSSLQAGAGAPPRRMWLFPHFSSPHWPLSLPRRFEDHPGCSRCRRHSRHSGARLRGADLRSPSSSAVGVWAAAPTVRPLSMTFTFEWRKSDFSLPNCTRAVFEIILYFYIRQRDYGHSAITSSQGTFLGDFLWSPWGTGRGRISGARRAASSPSRHRHPPPDAEAGPEGLPLPEAIRHGALQMLGTLPLALPFIHAMHACTQSLTVPSTPRRTQHTAPRPRAEAAPTGEHRQ